MTLDPIQLRVLGALIEKEIATPDYYPLLLNSILAACNQRSSRDPVMELSEDEIVRALDSLGDLGLTSIVRDSRVPKYEHRVRTVLNLRRDETAVLCLLLLRGAQTPGELRARADRLYSFDGIEAVESTLGRLMVTSMENESAVRPLVALLPRQPGSRESRYMHLLSGPIEAASVENESDRARSSAVSAGQELVARVARLEEQVASLHALMERFESILGDAPAQRKVIDGEASGG